MYFVRVSITGMTLTGMILDSVHAFVGIYLKAELGMDLWHVQRKDTWHSIGDQDTLWKFDCWIILCWNCRGIQRYSSNYELKDRCTEDNTKERVNCQWLLSLHLKSLKENYMENFVSMSLETFCLPISNWMRSITWCTCDRYRQTTVVKWCTVTQPLINNFLCYHYAQLSTVSAPDTSLWGYHSVGSHVSIEGMQMQKNSLLFSHWFSVKIMEFCEKRLSLHGTSSETYDMIFYASRSGFASSCIWCKLYLIWKGFSKSFDAFTIALLIPYDDYSSYLQTHVLLRYGKNYFPIRNNSTEHFKCTLVY